MAETERSPLEKSIMEMARGGIQEMVDYEMGRILSNIMDPNTKATDKRKVKVELEFVPDEYRQTVKVSAQVTSKLAVTSAVQTMLYMRVGKDGIGATEMTAQIPGQTSIYDAEQGPAPVLRIIKSA